MFWKKNLFYSGLKKTKSVGWFPQLIRWIYLFEFMNLVEWTDEAFVLVRINQCVEQERRWINTCQYEVRHTLLAMNEVFHGERSEWNQEDNNARSRKIDQLSAELDEFKRVNERHADGGKRHQKK